MEPELVTILVGRGGWVRVAVHSIEGIATSTMSESALDADIYARAVIDEAGGRVRVAELHLDGGTGFLTGEVLRNLPYSRVEGALNTRGLAVAIATSIDQAGASHDPTPFAELVPEPPAGEAPRPSGEHTWTYSNGTVLMRFPLHSQPEDLLLRPFPESAPRIRDIEPAPANRKRPDEFYRQVLDAFNRAASAGPRPAARIAEANGVPVSMIHRWVKEARRRGLTVPVAGEAAPTTRKRRTR